MVKSEPIVVIDTRDPATYAAGHLPNAVNIHDIFTYLATSTPEGVAAMREKFASTSAITQRPWRACMAFTSARKRSSTKVRSGR